MPQFNIYNKKNLELLAEMESGSLHAVVTDCPYGFGEEPDATETLRAWIDKGYHEIGGSGFMGKKWDAFVPQPQFWKEVYRVLKPGGYVLAFFGTRTYDWGTLAIRLGGFEIRDCIQWIYGSGFPKSHDVSKAIDKAAGAEREVVGAYQCPDGMPRNYEEHVGSDGEIPYGHNKGGARPITAPATEAAKQWQGYGTALKPACELVCVARKPLDGTVANNALTHGCGAINLDGCRIEPSEGDDPRLGGKGTWSSSKMAKNVYEGGYAGIDVGSSPLGRFPANVILDEEAGRVLDEQSGVSKSSGKGGKSERGSKLVEEYWGEGGGGFKVGRSTVAHSDTGGASRFFYCAKASKADRNYGCDDLQEKDPACVTDFRPSLKESPENWTNGTENAYMRTTPKKNNHPTVKPIKLMRYLVRLVKPPIEDACIADFYMGSGTTGVACMLEGINFIGCDDDENSFAISQARIAHAQKEYLTKPVQQTLF